MSVTIRTKMKLNASPQKANEARISCDLRWYDFKHARHSSRAKILEIRLIEINVVSQGNIVINVIYINIDMNLTFLWK